jgi:hypothetical protein
LTYVNCISKNSKKLLTGKKSLSRLRIKHGMIWGGGGGSPLSHTVEGDEVCMYIFFKVHNRMKPMGIVKWKSTLQLRIKSIIHRYTEKLIPLKVTLFKMNREE